MISYGYIIMIVVDSCMIWFHFDCIMQLKKSYHIATYACSRKGATTFGDLPNWLRLQFNDQSLFKKRKQPDWCETIWHENSTVDFSGRNIDFNGSIIESVFILDQDLKPL